MYLPLFSFASTYYLLTILNLFLDNCFKSLHNSHSNTSMEICCCTRKSGNKFCFHHSLLNVPVIDWCSRWTLLFPIWACVYRQWLITIWLLDCWMCTILQPKPYWYCVFRLKQYGLSLYMLANVSIPAAKLLWSCLETNFSKSTFMRTYIVYNFKFYFYYFS